MSCTIVIMAIEEIIYCESMGTMTKDQLSQLLERGISSELKEVKLSGAKLFGSQKGFLGSPYYMVSRTEQIIYWRSNEIMGYGAEI